MDKSSIDITDSRVRNAQQDIIVKLCGGISSDAYAKYLKQLIVMHQLVIEAEKCVKHAENICYPKVKPKHSIKIFQGVRFLYGQDSH